MSRAPRTPRIKRLEAPKPVEVGIDHGCLDRLSAFAAQRRAELGEARWAELQKGWDA